MQTGPICYVFQYPLLLFRFNLSSYITQKTLQQNETMDVTSQICHEMVQSCEKTIHEEKGYADVPVRIEIVKEKNAIGNATGIM